MSRSLKGSKVGDVDEIISFDTTYMDVVDQDVSLHQIRQRYLPSDGPPRTCTRR